MFAGILHYKDGTRVPLDIPGFYQEHQIFVPQDIHFENEFFRLDSPPTRNKIFMYFEIEEKDAKQPKRIIPFREYLH